MMYLCRRPPPAVASLVLRVAAVVAATVALSTPTKSFAFQTATPTTAASSLSVRLPFPVKIATSSSSSSLSHFSSLSSLPSSQHPRHYQNDGKIALSMSSSDDSKEATSNNNNSGGTASIPNEVFNLVKSIVGAGVLSLPAGACWT